MLGISTSNALVAELAKKAEKVEKEFRTRAEATEGSQKTRIFEMSMAGDI